MGIIHFTWPKMGQSIPDCDQCPPGKVFAPVLHKNAVLTLSPSWISPHFLILQLCKGLAARFVSSWPTTFPHSGYFISASELSSVFAWPLSYLLYITRVCVVLSKVEVLFSCPHEPQGCADTTDHLLTTACFLAQCSAAAHDWHITDLAHCSAS